MNNKSTPTHGIADMVGDWEETTLGDCADWLSGGTPSKGNVEFWCGSIPWVSAKDMKSFHLYDAEDHISPLAIGNGGKVVPAGTIFVLVRGMTLHHDVPICMTHREMAFNQDIKALRPAKNVDGAFLAYWLLAHKPDLLASVDQAGHGTGRLVTDTLKKKRVQLPSLQEQKAIAGMLGTLDAKIECNRRMNATLESMARALFQSWFVDFDPVRAKLDGRAPTGIDPATAALFPANFEHTADGVVPIGWTRKCWGDIATLEYGKSLRDYRENSGKYRVYGTNGPIGFHNEPLCHSAGIIIGRKGAYRGVHYSPDPFFVIDTAFYVKPRTPIDLKWAYYELVRLDINSMDSGSAIPSTSRDDFYGLPVIMPPSEVQQSFGKLIGPLFNTMAANDKQSRTLAAIRDALLPKLLSGELRVAG